MNEPLDVLDHPLLLMPPARVAMPLAWAGHIPFARLLVELTRPRTIVELGTHTGNSYNAFCQAVDFLGLDSRCYAVDTWEGDPQSGRYGPEIYEELRAYQASRYQHFSTLLKMTFDEAADRFEPGAIDLLHIDGLHTYEAVRHDFETWLPKMSPRGVMLFHDINVHHGDFGVWRLWQELKARNPGLEYPHSHGLGIIAVGPDIPEPLRRLMDLDEPRRQRFAALLEQLGGYVTNERQVQVLEEKIQALEERIRALEGMARTLQAEVAFLDRELTETRRVRDVVGQHLQDVLGDVRLLTATLEEIRRSRSWRWLAPVRWYGLQRQRAGKLWWALPTLAARAGGWRELLWFTLNVWRREGMAGVRAMAARQVALATPTGGRPEATRPPDMGWAPASGKPEILFVSHDASRTGAPIFLLSLIAYLVKHLDVACTILLARGGELEPDFRKLGNTVVLRSRDLPDPVVFDALRQRNFRLAYFNTITNGALQSRLKALGCPILCHVHELGFSIEHFFGERNLKQVLASTDLFLAGSKAVRAHLEKWVSPERVVLAYPFIDMEVNRRAASLASPPLDLPRGAVVVGACGTIGWRKGSDVFVQLARRVLAATGKPVIFVWLGGPVAQGEYHSLLYDAQVMGIEKHLVFPGQVEPHLPYFAQFDIFVLPSREDPFPLVMLDAASLGKPVVCFEHAGGAPEFVENDAGFVVPYLDVDAMAAAVVRLVEDPQLRAALGECGRRKTRERHDLGVGAEQIARTLRQFLAPQTA